MARASSTIEQLNADIALERLVVARGIELTERGDTLVGACPWCGQGDTLVVKPKANTWECPPCSVGGGVVDWVMRIEGVSQKHAVELLRADALGDGDARVVVKATVPKLASAVQTDVAPTVMVQQVLAYYHSCLLESPEALAYLQRRGIRSQEALEHFNIGFCNRTLGFRIPAKNRAAGKTIRGVLTDAGLLRRSGHEHFRGSIVFPIHDEHGHITQVYGRKITGNLRRGTDDHTWLSGERRGVWNREALA